MMLTHLAGSVATADGHQTANETRTGRKDLPYSGIPPGKARAKQDGEVAHLMGDLVHQDSEHGEESQPQRDQERATYG